MENDRHGFWGSWSGWREERETISAERK